MRLYVASVVCVLLALSFPGIISRLEESFTACGDFFFQEKSPVLPGILDNSVTQDNRYKIICQKYMNKIRFATLYDTTNRIPVFSAYKYTGTDESMTPEIPRIWMTELQLEQHLDADMRKPFLYQARNEDYWIKDTSMPTVECTHGTLFSMKHTADLETAESTFTLSNTVPDQVGFKGRIGTLVNKFRNFMDQNCLDSNNNIAAYVLTGAIPSKATWNKRVNIPSFLWTAFCCYNSSTTSMVSRTYRYANKKDNIPVNIKDLESLEEFLQKHMLTGVKPTLFNNNCESN